MNVYCQQCKTATAVVHVTELKSGKKTELHLCEECAQDTEYSPKIQHPSMQFLQQIMEKVGSSARPRDRECPSCGMTFSEFKAKGRFGCARDYDVFLERLAPLLERMHDSSSHVDVPPGAKASDPGIEEEEPQPASEQPPPPPAEPDPEQEQRNELRRLKRALQRAVKAEKYEDAAELRDQIRTLEESGPASDVASGEEAGS